jgi:hypothetical protein
MRECDGQLHDGPGRDSESAESVRQVRGNGSKDEHDDPHDRIGLFDRDGEEIDVSHVATNESDGEDDAILEQLTDRQHFRVGTELLRDLFEWVCADARGVASVGRKFRLLCCWLWPEMIGAKNPQELAEQDGVCKQTYNELARKFRERFPGFIAPGMRSANGRAHMRAAALARKAA